MAISASSPSYIEKLFFDPNVLQLSERDFFRWIHLISSHIETASTNTIQIIFKEIFRLREEVSKKGVPSFLTPGKIEGGAIKERPKFSLLPINPSEDETLRASPPPTDLPTTPLNREDLQAAFDYLLSLDYISWDHKDEGCFIRASIALEHLLSLLVPSADLFLVYIPLDGKNQYGWEFHEVVGVQLEDESLWVIDPILDKKNPLSLSDWCEKIKPAKKEPTEVFDARDLPKIDGKDFFSQSGNLVILLPPFTTHSPIEDGIPDFYPLPPEERNVYFEINAHLSDKSAHTLLKDGKIPLIFARLSP